MAGHDLATCSWAQVRRAAEVLQRDGGDEALFLIEGPPLLPTELTVEGLHPNGAGMQAMAERLNAQLGFSRVALEVHAVTRRIKPPSSVALTRPPRPPHAPHATAVSPVVLRCSLARPCAFG